MNKIKNVKVVNRTTIELMQDAYKGDRIDLNDINRVNTSKLDEIINKQVEKKLNEQKENIIKNTINEEYKKYYSKINNLESTLKIINTEKENEKLKALNDQKDSFNKQISDLQVKLNTIEKTKDAEKAKELFDQARKFDNEKHTLEMLINNLKNEKNFKSNVNSKYLGEQLEQQLKNDYECVASVGGFPHCKFYKDNIAVSDENSKSSKADFIFEIWDKNEKNKLTSICIEAKNQNQNTSGVHKHNDDYLPKLAKDTEKKKCNYGLLITALELDNSFVFKKVNKPEFSNIYMCRPDFWIDVLTIFYNFTILISKEKTNLEEIKNSFMSQNEQYEQKSRIENNISVLKMGLKKTIDFINSNADEIFKNAEQIVKQAYAIQSIVNKNIKDRIQVAIRKIHNFGLKKKDLDLFEQDTFAFTDIKSQSQHTTSVAYMSNKKIKNKQ